MAQHELPEFDLGPSAQTYTLDDLCEICQVTVESVYEWVDYGVLNPEGVSIAEWRFSTHALIQARRACRLQRDLALNLAGIALVLELVDDVRRLRRELELARAQLARFAPFDNACD